jgi:anion transporter
VIAPKAIAAVAVLAAVALLLAPPIAGLAWQAQAAAALSLAAIALWATAAMPEIVTSLLFFLGAVLLKVAEPAVIFSGFASSALWLVLGGMVIGVAVKDTGLGSRFARTLASRFGRSYLGIIAGMVGIGVALGFLMPSSTGRIVLLLPITLALAERFGFPRGSNGYIGMVMATCYGTFVVPFTVLTSNIPNIVLSGAAEKLYGVEIVYGTYLLAHFPVLGALKAVMTSFVIAWMLPDQPRGMATEPAPRTRMTRDEWVLAAILAGSLLLFVTDAVHRISAAWISLAAGVVCLLPGINLVSLQAFNEKIAFGTLFYVSAVLGVGAILDASGLAAVVAQLLISVAPLAPGDTVTNCAIVVGFSMLVAFATMLPGLVAATAPLCGRIAEAAGMPVATVLQLQALAYSTPVLPYQGPPLVIGLQMTHVAVGPATRICLVMAALTVAVLFPLDYLWWRILGLL